MKCRDCNFRVLAFQSLNLLLLILAIVTISFSIGYLIKYNQIDLRLSSHCVFSTITGCICSTFCIVGSFAVTRRRPRLLKLFVFIVTMIAIIHLMLAILAFDTAYTMNREKTKDAFYDIFAKLNLETETIQRKMKCCGLENAKSWGVRIPRSCCDSANCTLENSYVGCTDKLVDNYKRLKVMFGIVAVVTVVISCLVVMTANLVIRFSQ